MSESIGVVIKENKSRSKLANPAPLGLAGFGITTFLLMCHNAGLWEQFDSMIMGTAIIFGGFAQMVAGILEFFKGNIFGLVAFTSYGAFWISLCLMEILPKGFGIDPPTYLGQTFFFFIWAMFTFFLLISTFKLQKIAVIQIIFIILELEFILLAIEKLLLNFGAVNLAIILKTIIGIIGIILGLLALYLSGAEVVNAHYNREIFPLVIVVDSKDNKKL